MSERCETIKQVHDLTINEIGLVFNAYKQKFDRVLTDDLEGLYTSGCWSGDYVGRLVSKLKAYQNSQT